MRVSYQNIQLDLTGQSARWHFPKGIGIGGVVLASIQIVLLDYFKTVL